MHFPNCITNEIVAIISVGCNAITSKFKNQIDIVRRPLDANNSGNVFCTYAEVLYCWIKSTQIVYETAASPRLLCYPKA